MPQEISDEQAIPVSDMFLTAYFAADEAEVTSGDTGRLWLRHRLACSLFLALGCSADAVSVSIDRETSRLDVLRR